jgi:hypothetical protein
MQRSNRRTNLIASCLLWLLAGPLFILWRFHHQRNIVRCDGGEGQTNEG